MFYRGFVLYIVTLCSLYLSKNIQVLFDNLWFSYFSELYEYLSEIFMGNFSIAIVCMEKKPQQFPQYFFNCLVGGVKKLSKEVNVEMTEMREQEG